jgi:hypothetical protein
MLQLRPGGYERAVYAATAGLDLGSGMQRTLKCNSTMQSESRIDCLLHAWLLAIYIRARLLQGVLLLSLSWRLVWLIGTTNQNLGVTYQRCEEGMRCVSANYRDVNLDIQNVSGTFATQLTVHSTNSRL